MATFIEYFAGAAVEVVIFGVAGGILYRVWRGASFLPQRKTLLPFNKGVVLEGERAIKVLDPGSYWIKPRQSLVPVDVRPRPFQTASRELITADNLGIRIRFSGEYKVIEPASFVLASTDGHGAFYLALEREITLTVIESKRVEILEARISPADRVKERIEPQASNLGITVSNLEVSELIPIGGEQYFPNSDADPNL
jgi:regulator of protease activity HflC (stomatin/prohibitin superfamily)